MNHVGTEHHRGWFLPLRLATYIILSIVVVFWMGLPGYLNPQFVLYSICTLALCLSIAFQRKFQFRAVTQLVIALQFIFEITLEAGIIYATGNLHSSYSALFLLTIVSAALAYRLAGTLVVASVSSIAFSFIAWFGLHGAGGELISLQAFKSLVVVDETIFYSIFLHILIFYLVAFISGYLAERLRFQNRRLEDASQALRRARLETDDILRHLNSGLLTIDFRGRVLYFNRAAERILGYREEEVRGMGCSEVFAERMPGLSDSLLRCLRGESGRPRKEIEIIDGDGRRMPLGLSTSILTGDNDRPRGVIAIFTDLTDAKEMEQKVRAADRLSAVGELSASIAHEIRNPLAAISGSVEVLKSELELDGANERLMELIIKESHRLNVILSEFLTYARLGRPSYNKVELCHLISDVVEVLRHHESFHDEVWVSLDTAESCVYVVGDEGLLKQVLMNLAINACESFEGDPGTIKFKVTNELSDGKVVLSIEDNGPGIGHEHLDRIFEPFYSTKKQGTGLGLAIVHRICSLLNLNLDVESGQGSGTRFIIDMLRYSSEESPAMAGDSESHVETAVTA